MAIADYTEDFESMVTSDLDGGVPYHSGWPNSYTPPHVYIDTDGIGTNTTQVVEVQGFSSLEYDIPSGDRQSPGRFSFDVNLDNTVNGSPGTPAGRFLLRTSSYYVAAEFSWYLGTSGNYTLQDSFGGGGSVEDVLTPGTWHNVEFRYDNDTALCSLFVDSVPVYIDSTYATSYTGDYSTTTVSFARLLHYLGGPTNSIYYDNLFIPEPATCLLLGSGLVLLRRRKRA
jgi:hypothetical protein